MPNPIASKRSGCDTCSAARCCALRKVCILFALSHSFDLIFAFAEIMNKLRPAAVSAPLSAPPVRCLLPLLCPDLR